MSDTLVTIEGQVQLGSILTASYYDYSGNQLPYDTIQWVGLVKLKVDMADWDSASVLSTTSTLRITNQTPYAIRCRVTSNNETTYSDIILVVGNLKSTQTLNSVASSLNILGKGIDYQTPINSISRSSQVATDIQRINQSLYIILTTVKGSIPMLPQLGSDLASMLFTILDPEDLTSIELAVRSDLSIQEPRISITDLIINFLPEDNLLKISLTYNIVNTNITSNFIYNKTLVGDNL